MRKIATLVQLLTKVAAVGLVIAMLVSAVACGGETPKTEPAKTETAQKGTLKIGVQSVLSGGGIKWGVGWLQGVEMCIEDWNAQGGLNVGGKIYEVEYVSVDDKYTGSGGIEAANRLIFEENCKFVAGSIGTASTVTAAPIYNKNKVLNFNTTAGCLPSPDLPYTFHNGHPAEGRVYIMYGLITKHLPEVQKIAIITPSDETGKSMGEMIRDKVGPLFDLEVVKYREYEKGVTDFYPILAPILADNPDAIDTGGSAAMDAALITKQARELGFEGPILLSWSMVVATQTEVAGEYADNSYGQGSGAEVKASWITAETIQFMERWRSKYGTDAGDLLTTLHGYWGTDGLFQAIEKAGTLDTSKVKDVWETLEWTTLGSPIRWGGKEYYGIQRQLVHESEMIGIKEGKPVGVGLLTSDEVAQLPPYK